MIYDSTASELRSEEAFHQFLSDFECCRIPSGDWTHAAHVAMAAAYLLTRPKAEAIDAARTSIQRFNESHGVKTTIERGYHESLTRLWIHVCDAFLQESGLCGVEAARALVAVYGRRSALHKEYYGYDVVRSEARYQWRPTDLKALPAAWRKGDLLISTNPLLLHVATIHNFLKDSYWSPGIPRHVVERAIQGSVPFGLYAAGRQVGFARVVTDLATYGYLADVFISETHRGQGLSKWLMECILAHPSLEGFRRWQLATRDAHGLYSQFGFVQTAHPDRWMEIARPDVYRTAAEA